MTNSVNSVNSGSDKRNSTPNGGSMNPIQTKSLTKAFMLMLLAIVALVGNAAAQCNGKEVHLELPAGWGSNLFIAVGGQFPQQTFTRSGDYAVFTISGVPNDAATVTFAFANTASYHEASGMMWITKGTTGNNASPGIQSGQSPQYGTNPFRCSDLNSNGITYIYRSPPGTNTVVVSNTPSDSKYFYFWPPETDDKRWIVGTPYLVIETAGTQKAYLMQGDPDASSCGWYRYVFSSATTPVPDKAWVVLNAKNTNDAKPGNIIGANGFPAGEGGVTHIDFTDRFGGSTDIFYTPSDGAAGWGTLKNKSDIGRCEYYLAANIYHTSPQANSSFSRYGAGGNAEGICGGFVQDRLVNGKIQWKGQKQCSGATDWTAQNFADAFKSTPGKNVNRCYNMKFQRRPSGLWEFDASYLCTNNHVDFAGDGACVGNGQPIGGFYPTNLLQKTEWIGDKYYDYTGQRTTIDGVQQPDLGGYAACSGCGSTYDGDSRVRPKPGYEWCYDRGWLGEGMGDLSEANTPAAINTEMSRECTRRFAQGEITEGGNILDATYGTPKGITGLLCFESGADFIYEPGQEFFFRGDDDIWVFINNRLVIDLGGNHMPAPGYVKLDTIGYDNPAEKLEAGKSYPINIFFCDRRATGSNVRIATNMYISQSTGWRAPGDTYGSGKNVCLTITKGSGGTCGATSNDGSSETYCREDQGVNMEFYLVNQDGREISLPNPTNYGSIVITKNPYNVKITGDNFPGLDPGSYTIMVRQVGTDNKYPVETFIVEGNVRVVWGRVLKDGQELYNFGSKDTSTVTGRLVPVGFANAIAGEGNTFNVYGGGAFKLDPASLYSNVRMYSRPTDNDRSSRLRVYGYNSDGDFVEFDQNRLRETFTIPSTGTTPGLLILYVTGDYDAVDDANYAINIEKGKSDSYNVKAYLPRLRFIDPSTKDAPNGPTIWPNEAKTCLTKGSYIDDIPCPQAAVSASDMIGYMNYSQDRTIAIYDVSKTNGSMEGATVCKEGCDEVPILETTYLEAWANTDDDPDPMLGQLMDLVDFTPYSLSKGIFEFSFSGKKQLMPGTGGSKGQYAFFKTGPSKELAQWDTLYFEPPPVPYPIKVEIFDRNGDGIGDSVRVIYDKPLVATSADQNEDYSLLELVDFKGITGARRDSMPNNIEVFWDLSLPDTISFGPIPKASATTTRGYEYGTDCSTQASNNLFEYWKDKIEQDESGLYRVIVLKYEDAKNGKPLLKGEASEGFSGNNIKTSVGEGKIMVNSWSSFINKKTTKCSHQPFDERIDDKIPAIVVSATYVPDESAGCSENSASGCRDRLMVNLSEAVQMDPDITDKNNAVKESFAYKLFRSFGEDHVDGSEFKIHKRPQDLADRFTWTPSGGNSPSGNKDSSTTIVFKSYRVASDSTRTPISGDSIKFANSSLDGFNLVLLDLADNKPNPNEIGKRIEGINRFNTRPITITELNPEDNALENALKDIFPDLDLFKPGNSIEVLPIPDGIGGTVEEFIRANYPGSIGMVFNQDVYNTIYNEIERKNAGVKVPPSAISFHVKTFYHTNLGDFVVNRNLPAVSCENPIFAADIAGSRNNCLDNRNSIYVAWNLKDAKNRWVGAGAYVGLYDFYWQVSCKRETCGIDKTWVFNKTERKTQMHGVKRTKKK